jgi:propanol-preferring alcohol dehydrogenase
VQYAKAMGLRVIAMDIGHEKLKFCMEIGADFVVSALDPDAAAQVVAITNGGSHGVCVFASQASAFQAAITMCRRKVSINLIVLIDQKSEA